MYASQRYPSKNRGSNSTVRCHQCSADCAGQFVVGHGHGMAGRRVVGMGGDQLLGCLATFPQHVDHLSFFGRLGRLSPQIQILRDRLRSLGAAGLVSFTRPPSHQVRDRGGDDRGAQNHGEDGQDGPPIACERRVMGTAAAVCLSMGHGQKPVEKTEDAGHCLGSAHQYLSHCRLSLRERGVLSRSESRHLFRRRYLSWPTQDGSCTADRIDGRRTGTRDFRPSFPASGRTKRRNCPRPLPRV